MTPSVLNGYIMKNPLIRRAINLFLRIVFFGYAASFAIWWYVSPKGFAVENLRFWSNSVIPIIIILCSLSCWLDMFRSNRLILSVCIFSYPVATIAFIITSLFLYPISMQPVFLTVLLSWFMVLLLLACYTIIQHPLKAVTWIPTGILTGLSVIMGIILPYSQRSWEPATHPLNQAQSDSDPVLNTTQSAFHLSGPVTVLPRYADIIINDQYTQLQISPLLTFYSCSPDRCWILFAPQKEKIGTPRIYQGIRRIEDGLYLEYNERGKSTLEVTIPNDGHSVRLDAFCSIPTPVYSHLNTFSEFSIKGKEKIYVSFSPCPDKRIEVTAFDYPFGRPARLAYLDTSGAFRVVQAKSAEKGPFTTLAEGTLTREESLHITLYDGNTAVYRIRFEDWAAQCSKQISPTAGWGLPENAIEFSLDGEKENHATFYITLASTSAGRGFDSVGHKAGIYRNRMSIEFLDNSE